MKPPLTLVALLLLLAGCGGEAPANERIVETLQFLIDAQRENHFPDAQTYCIAAGQDGAAPSDRVVAQLQGRGMEVVATDACAPDEDRGEVQLARDSTPAVILWARAATEAEEETFSPEGESDAAWRDTATLIIAGFYRSEISSADFLCWFESPNGGLVQCDLHGIS